MRENKFRVWNKVLGQYIDKDYHKNYYLNFDGILCAFNDFGLVLPLDMKNYIIERYIGLKDKNSAEICDGDSVHIYYYIQDKTTDKQIWFDKDVIVKWCNDDIHYGYYGTTNDGDDYYNLNNYSDREVIGNIHEK